MKRLLSVAGLIGIGLVANANWSNYMLLESPYDLDGFDPLLYSENVVELENPKGPIKYGVTSIACDVDISLALLQIQIPGLGPTSSMSMIDINFVGKSDDFRPVDGIMFTDGGVQWAYGYAQDVAIEMENVKSIEVSYYERDGSVYKFSIDGKGITRTDAYMGCFGDFE